MKESHKKAISYAKMGHKHSQETKDKIGKANKGVWVQYNCLNCGKKCEEKISHFKRKKRHYCSRDCYSEHRKTWKKEEQHSFGSGHTPEERDRRIKCRNKTNKAINKGLLNRMPCEVCGEQKTEAHHDDYDKPLNVRWLCFKHHRQYHKEHPQLLEQ